MVTVLAALAALAGPMTNVSAPGPPVSVYLPPPLMIWRWSCRRSLDLGVARGGDGVHGFEQHQPLEEWAQGIADGAVNPVIAAVVDVRHCRLADDVVQIVDVVVVVTGPTVQRILTGATVKAISPAEVRDDIGSRCASEIGIVQFGADNGCHNPGLQEPKSNFFSIGTRTAFLGPVHLAHPMLCVIPTVGLPRN